MSRKHRHIPTRLAIGAGVVATTAGLALLFGSKLIGVPAYTAVKIFDGDTFETKEKQYIRLSGIDAPELGRCGSDEAKAALEQLLRGKKLYIKVLYHQGARLNGLVYSEKGLVETAMLRQGWAIMNDRDNVDLPELKNASDQAREQKIGIFSDLCTQTINKKNPTCVIKGNIRNAKEKTYHMPGCASYKNADVQLYKGDAWFCTEKEAISAGFTKAAQCQ